MKITTTAMAYTICDAVPVPTMDTTAVSRSLRMASMTSQYQHEPR